MYSPAARPSRTRAAPAKKRRLSEQTGISSRAYESGLPTLRDSIPASSSAFSSRTSASFRRSSARSAGVDSSHSGSALAAASTAASTSAAVQDGTSAIVSPVAGLSTSIVPPSAASVHLPPTKILLLVTVAMPQTSSSSSLGTKDSRLAGEALGDRDRDDRREQDQKDDHVHLGQLLAEADVPEDPDRQRILDAGGERGHDHLVEREREREERPGDQRCRDRRQRHVDERLEAVRAQVHRRLGQRRRHAAEPGDHVVEHDHDAERRVADDDRPQSERL